MTKKAKLRFLILLIVFFLIIFAILWLVIWLSTSKIDLDIDKLENFSSKVEILDKNNEKITYTTASGQQSVKLSALPHYVPKAFLSIEDKEFYNHNGLNYTRIIKACVKNIFSGYAKEGASTITQQLIKNTHLSSEKTIKRKVQEAILSKKLEKKYSKDEILNTYLNVIYFGNGAYGIEEAAQTYFNHSAAKLTLAESATLAGLIKSPKTYSPISNPQNCLLRRNLVLKNMLNDGVITNEEYDLAINSSLNTVNQSTSKSNYFRMVIDEAINVLNLSEKDLSSLGIKIYTYLDNDLQTECEKAEFSPNGGSVVIDNSTGGIISFCGNPTIKRQIGSLIKPILCYAPAFENGALSPISQILDEKIDYGNYSPQNVDKKYHGWVSVRKALAESLNIPAVKCLNYNGLSNSIKFANKLGLNFSNNDTHLALALGASENGENLLNITNAYATLARLGKYSNSHFIRKIESNSGKTLYLHKPKFTQEMTDATAFLINDILADCVESGTAQKLKLTKLKLCSKTGTVGTNVDSTNSDAWCVSFSPEYTVGVWIGNATTDRENNLKSTQNGGTVATKFSIPIWNKLALKKSITYFTPPSSVKSVKLDSLSLQNQKIELASQSTPEKYVITEYFNEKFVPTQESENFTLPPISKLNCEVDVDNLLLSWDGVDYLDYDLYCKNSSHTRKICALSGKNSTLTYKISAPNEECELYVVSHFKSNPSKESVSNSIKFVPTKQDNEPKNILKNWLNKRA